MSTDKISAFKAVDETTHTLNGNGLRVSAETWGGRSLVRIDVGNFGLPQYHQQEFFDAATAERIGASLIQLGLQGQLRDAGWLPAGDVDGAREGDWAPPEDRSNPWDFLSAVAEMRRRAAQ